jgi:hypothetical protein
MKAKDKTRDEISETCVGNKISEEVVHQLTADFA